MTEKAKAALADVGNYVLRADQVQTGPGGHSAAIWADPRTGNDYEVLHDSSAGTVMTPAQVKGWLDAGGLKIAGHREVNGHRAIGLRQPWARGYRELWVDARAFLPLRTVTADFADTTGPLKNVRLIGNETWLPRTTSLLDTVNHVHIPAGFQQVAPPR